MDRRTSTSVRVVNFTTLGSIITCPVSPLRPLSRAHTLEPAPRVAPPRPTPPGRKRSKGNPALAGARGVFLSPRAPRNPRLRRSARATPRKSVGASNLKEWQSLSIVGTVLNRSMNSLDNRRSRTRCALLFARTAPITRICFQVHADVEKRRRLESSPVA